MTAKEKTYSERQEFVVQQAIMGMVVEEEGGKIIRDSPIGILVKSPGFEDVKTDIKKTIFGSNPSEFSIDEDMSRHGAYIFRTIPEGLLAAKARYRPELGEGASSQEFALAKIWLLEGAKTWRDIPHSFFMACMTHLIAEPPIGTVPSSLDPLRILPNEELVIDKNGEKTRVIFDMDDFFTEFQTDSELRAITCRAFHATETGGRIDDIPLLSSTKALRYPRRTLECLEFIAFTHRDLTPERMKSEHPVDVFIGLRGLRSDTNVIAFNLAANILQLNQLSSEERNVFNKLKNRVENQRKEMQSTETIDNIPWPVDRHDRAIGIGTLELYI
ncbi:hypothetical protein [Cohaesibacter gelatinilyticus]|uniref:Uncharacterized protein n=1 Tax=Cohaesibacter gelatinilyticus TaxID=372072 RepID=A0A285PEH5_9HYPH|nr:hypothetical protein [Cohaesibacter gelatinilyticus]SNZ20115.1 hypothetical protein SAMN06265368_3216 [Cohaesibacter gelatinilyticus]